VGERERGIGAAVVGTGFIGVVHVEALRRIGVEVRGVVGSSPGRGRERAAAMGLPPAYDSLEAALADESVDVVHITSPNHLHHAHARAALEAGKHVVCEKPLGMTSAETAGLLELARASGRVHAVNFNIRHYPMGQQVRGLVAAGELGVVRLVTGSYLQDWLLLETDWNWRLEPELGGELRAVADIGSHWLDLLQHVTGLRVEAVLAELSTFIPFRQQPTGPVETFSTERAAETRTREVRTEDCATILLRFAGGARGCLTVSQISPGRKNALSFQIDGADSAAAWCSERPDDLWLGHRGRPNELLQRDPGLLNAAGAAASRLPGGHAEGFADTFAALYRLVYADVAAGRPSPDPVYATFADGHEELLLCDAIAASAAEGRFVEVATAAHAGGRS
jgi:predicted dehydrogenase